MDEQQIRQFIEEEIERRMTQGDLDTSTVDIEQTRELIREEVPLLLKKSTVAIEGNIQLLDGRNIIVGGTSGTKIATSTGQKIAFHGKSAIIQSASGNQDAISLDVDVTGGDTVDKSAINTNFTNIETLVNQLRTDLVNKGLIKGSA